MEREMTFDEALDRCRFLAAKGECCTFDLEQKMRNWGVQSKDIQRVIESLVAERFVDNLRFATAYVRDKTRFNHWGRVKTNSPDYLTLGVHRLSARVGNGRRGSLFVL